MKRLTIGSFPSAEKPQVVVVDLDLVVVVETIIQVDGVTMFVVMAFVLVSKLNQISLSFLGGVLVIDIKQQDDEDNYDDYGISIESLGQDVAAGRDDDLAVEDLESTDDLKEEVEIRIGSNQQECDEAEESVSGSKYLPRKFRP